MIIIIFVLSFLLLIAGLVITAHLPRYWSWRDVGAGYWFSLLCAAQFGIVPLIVLAIVKSG